MIISLIAVQHDLPAMVERREVVEGKGREAGEMEGLVVAGVPMGT